MSEVPHSNETGGAATKVVTLYDMSPDELVDLTEGALWANDAKLAETLATTAIQHLIKEDTYQNPEASLPWIDAAFVIRDLINTHRGITA